MTTLTQDPPAQTPVSAATVTSPGPFFFDPKNRAYAERRSPYLRRPRWYLGTAIGVLIGMGLIVCSLPWVVSVVSFELSHSSNDLSSTEGRTSGVYITRETHYDIDGNATYFVTYRYTLNDHPLTGKSEVSRELFDAAPGANNLEVRYSRDDPEITQLTFAASRSSSSTTADTWSNRAVIAMIGLLVVLRTFSGIRSLWRFYWLERSGRQISGEVINSWYKQDSEGFEKLHVNYRFMSPVSGQVIAGCWMRSPWTRRQRATLPVAGTPLHIRYVNDRLYEPLWTCSDVASSQ